MMGSLVNMRVGDCYHERRTLHPIAQCANGRVRVFERIFFDKSRVNQAPQETRFVITSEADPTLIWAAQNDPKMSYSGYGLYAPIRRHRR